MLLQEKIRQLAAAEWGSGARRRLRCWTDKRHVAAGNPLGTERGSDNSKQRRDDQNDEETSVDTGGEQHFILLDNIGITPVTVEIPADAGSEGRTQGYFGPEGVSELGTTRVASSRIGSISNKLNRNKPLFAPLRQLTQREMIISTLPPVIRHKNVTAVTFDRAGADFRRDRECRLAQ